MGSPKRYKSKHRSREEMVAEQEAKQDANPCVKRFKKKNAKSLSSQEMEAIILSVRRDYLSHVEAASLHRTNV